MTLLIQRAVARTPFLGLTLAALGFAAAGHAGPLDSLAPGTWYEFPSSHMDSAAPAGADVRAVMYAWSSGVYDSDRDQLVVFGGGHTDYSGNEVYAFGPITGTSPKWTRLTDPSN